MFKSLFLILGLLATFSLHATAQQCGRTCKFRLCRADGSDFNLRPKGTRILLRAPKTSLSAYLCRKFPGGRSLGRVRSTGEAIISGKFPPVAISKWRPAGLSPKFSKRYFKLINILYLGGLQGIGRIQPKGNQEDFLDDKCVVLPITTYDIVDGSGKVFRTISSTGPKDCVAVKTRVQPIVVELTWSSEDDFDLSVTGPSGSKSFSNNDNVVGQCGVVPVVPAGKETVTYDDPKNGKYNVNVKHFNSCKGEKTNWTLRLVVNGVTVLTRKGRSSSGGGRVVGEEDFFYP